VFVVCVVYNSYELHFPTFECYMSILLRPLVLPRTLISSCYYTCYVVLVMPMFIVSLLIMPMFNPTLKPFMMPQVLLKSCKLSLFFNVLYEMILCCFQSWKLLLVHVKLLITLACTPSKSLCKYNTFQRSHSRELV